ncbi:hypothetical protein PR048_022031 [Dryococelus australis]|uniref:Uncharacterized protein n=1 Tax=Dryococelus australis TaxID=614101 RepID=A0ABQ9GZV3_9NEOP|nr:hypothetical protein PR048_022031 [Dryococelus australis]
MTDDKPIRVSSYKGMPSRILRHGAVNLGVYLKNFLVHSPSVSQRDSGVRRTFQIGRLIQYKHDGRPSRELMRVGSLDDCAAYRWLPTRRLKCVACIAHSDDAALDARANVALSVRSLLCHVGSGVAPEVNSERKICDCEHQCSEKRDCAFTPTLKPRSPVSVGCKKKKKNYVKMSHATEGKEIRRRESSTNVPRLQNKDYNDLCSGSKILSRIGKLPLLPCRAGEIWSGAGMIGRGKREIPEKTSPNNGIVRHDSHMQKSGVTRSGIEPGSPDLGGGEEDKIDVKPAYTEVNYAIGSQFLRHALDDSEPIADLQGNKSPIKPADQRQFPHAKIRSDLAGDGTRIAFSGGEQANRSAIVTPVCICVCVCVVPSEVNARFPCHGVASPCAVLCDDAKAMVYDRRGGGGYLRSVEVTCPRTQAGCRQQYLRHVSAPPRPPTPLQSWEATF